MHKLIIVTKTAVLPVIWLIFVGHTYFLWSETYQPEIGSIRRGQTLSGDLKFTVSWTLVETVAVFAILRPWSYRQNWGRALVIFAIGIPWSFFSILIQMHGSIVTAQHAFWVLILTGAGLLLTLLHLIATNLPTVLFPRS